MTIALDTILGRALDAYDAGDATTLQRCLHQARGAGAAPADLAELRARLAFLRDDPARAPRRGGVGTGPPARRPGAALPSPPTPSRPGPPPRRGRPRQHPGGGRPDNPDYWHLLGCIHLDRDDIPAARRAFHEVRRLDLLDETPLRLSQAEFDAAIEDALEQLPEPVLQAMPNLAVIAEEYPDAAMVDEEPYDPRLLGLFTGPTAVDFGSHEMVPQGPALVYIFQRNLERETHSRADLIEQITITVLHEIGHYLGLDEADLEARGLD